MGGNNPRKKEFKLLKAVLRGAKNPRKKWFKFLGENWDRIFEKTRVGFGRTELSIRLSCTEFCALSSGHGPRVLGFQGGEEGVDFHVFWGGFGRYWGGPKLETHFSKKIGSDLVVQISR